MGRAQSSHIWSVGTPATLWRGTTSIEEGNPMKIPAVTPAGSTRRTTLHMFEFPDANNICISWAIGRGLKWNPCVKYSAAHGPLLNTVSVTVLVMPNAGTVVDFVQLHFEILISLVGRFVLSAQVQVMIAIRSTGWIRVLQGDTCWRTGTICGAEGENWPVASYSTASKRLLKPLSFFSLALAASRFSSFSELREMRPNLADSRHIPTRYFKNLQQNSISVIEEPATRQIDDIWI